MAISLVILLFSLLTLAFPLILCVNFVASSYPHSTHSTHSTHVQISPFLQSLADTR